ncbi:MAG: ABC transporter ATP-binding protein [Cycloclasticus sp. symbiont of Poecilosclerida sp. M]|nr:MAG: ABC transporter ATP-binding protein [Cycloclasticus sp. symbiont of Poecilosclerida sp. M]
MQSPLLSVRGLKTEFSQSGQTIKAVDGISFDIAKGETFALVGESGCGKSVSALSVLRLLPRNAKVREGQVLFQGQDLLHEPEFNMRTIRGSRISMIFQDPMSALNPVMTIGEQISECFAIHDNVGQKSHKNEVLKLIKQVGLAEPSVRYNEYPHQLSGGMRQRVVIAIALANKPDLLIADEPTTALDVTIQAQILQLLKDLQSELGMALWIITHDLGLVSEYADRVAVMYAGELVEVAPNETFFDVHKPHHPYTKRLFDALPSTQKRDTLLTTLKGAVPSLSSKFKGCRFAERCPLKQADCLSAEVDWRDESPRHQIRCLHYGIEQAEVNAEKFNASNATTDSTGSLLRIDDLKIHFPIKKGFFKRTCGYVKAVDGVSLDIKAGTTAALVGESGCGKTTLGKGVLQLLPITSGSIAYRGEELTQLSEQQLRQYRHHLQIIFQDPFSSMNPRLLVGEVIREGFQSLSQQLSDTEKTQRCEELLQQVGLNPDTQLCYPHEFSGGQRQRICIARALAANPSLIVCDEPTSALDVSVQAQVLNLLKKLQIESGLSYLFITHDLSVVSFIADTVAVMYLGRIVEQGTTEEVLQNPAHPYTKALLAAVPEWDKSKKIKTIKLADNLPSASNPPSGCHFHTRCEEAMPDCSQIEPAKHGLSATHDVSCLKFKNE